MAAGRPPKLAIDAQLQGKIMAMVRAGMFPERAAVAAGVAERTHYLWQAKGLEEREHRENPKNKPRVTWQVYLDYANELEQAVAEAEFLLVGNITKGGAGAADLRWLLERRFRDRWSGKAPAAPAVPAAPAAGGNVTPLAAATARREQRRVQKTS